jgi:plastocyanin domain-containing protein
MNGTEWVVVAGGLAAIAWVNWYFFLAERTTSVVARPDAASGTAGSDAVPTTPEVVIEVRGGYSPSTVRVPAGRPVRLVFDRQETSSCSEEIVFPDFAVRKFLPAGERTVVEVTPPMPGSYEFMCGMSMLRGRLIAEE